MPSGTMERLESISISLIRSIYRKLSDALNDFDYTFLMMIYKPIRSK